MIKIGNCSNCWGVWFAEDDKQMPWQRIADEISEIGYQYLELAPFGFWPEDPDVLLPELEKRGLKVVAGSYNCYFEDEEDMEENLNMIRRACKQTKTAGGEIMVLFEWMYCDMFTNEITRPPQPTEEEWNRMVKNIVRACKVIKEEFGMIPVIHPHAGTRLETTEQVYRLLDETDPETVYLCLDIGQYAYCHGDVMECIQKYGKRIKYLHLRNLDSKIRDKVFEEHLQYAAATKMGVWPELGKGDIDFVEVKKALDEAGFDGYGVIEMCCYPVEDQSQPYKTQKANFDYLKSIQFGQF